jgi:hypothetical protein
MLYPTFVAFDFKLTVWSGFLHEKVLAARLFKKFPAFYGTLRFFTVFSLKFE